MKIIATCPRCSWQNSLDFDRADRRVRCSACGKLFRVPPADEFGEALKTLQISSATVYVDKQGNIYA